MSQYNHTLVVACPDALASDTNHLSACWSENFALNAFNREPQYERNDEKIILKGTVVTDTLLTKATQAPQRHTDDTDELTDMTAASRAAENLIIIEHPAEGDPWPDMPAGKLLAFIDVSLNEVIDLLGLTKTELEEESA